MRVISGTTTDLRIGRDINAVVTLVCESTGGKDYQAELEQEGSYASFSVELGLGEDKLFAAFYGRGGTVVAPYYIYIAKQAD